MNRLKMDDISDFSADAATKYYRQRAMKLLEILEGQVLNIMAIYLFLTKQNLNDLKFQFNFFF